MGWRAKCDIHQHLAKAGELIPSDPVPDDVREGILIELRGLINTQPLAVFVPRYVVEPLEKAATVLEFNEALVRLFDWADLSKVWLGLPSFAEK